MKPLVIAGRAFQSRLIVGTGKYKDGAETQAAIEASGAEMVTVAVRRVNLDRSRLTRRTATVTISAPEASMAAWVSAPSLYFPVPTIRRD